MHVHFSGIGGAGLGPLSLIAKQIGYEVSGSDKQDSKYIDYLRSQGIKDIEIDQSFEAIARSHRAKPIDWLVYTSALTMENPRPPELEFCQQKGIKATKRDELINLILKDKQLKLIAVAGTHGKTTTTAMIVWLFKQLGKPFSYSLPSKVSFGEMGQYQVGSEYFIYEADEFDHNFLAFKPFISVISGVSWDHHEIFPSREDYKQAFNKFINQSNQTIIWQDDYDYLGLKPSPKLLVPNTTHPAILEISLKGYYNRLDAWLAILAVNLVTKLPVDQLLGSINKFPGLQRRMEPIIANLYSDYAHTPEKIRGAMSAALETARQNNQAVVVVYEPLTNRRQHFMQADYKDCFTGAKRVYWLPSYLAREDQNQRLIPPSELIANLSDPAIALPAERNEKLKQIIKSHLDQGDLVVGMAGGGGGSLDEWLHSQFSSRK